MKTMTTKEFILIPKSELKGKVIVFPTDTVYGIGALIDDFDAQYKIYQLKERDERKPLAILIAKVEDVYPYVKTIDDEVKNIMNHYWPGELTLIFERHEHISPKLTMNMPTIAFRMPNSEIALSIIRHLGPLATTSINLSGQAPLNNIEDISKQFGDQIDYLITDEVELSKLSSTVIDVTHKPYRILRQGNIKINV